MCAGRIRPWCLFALLALLLALAPLTVAEGEDGSNGLGQRLSKARFQEFTERNYDEALELYDALLLEVGLEPGIRGSALLGKSRCLVALGRIEEAVPLWETIVADARIPEDLRKQAKSRHDAFIAENSARTEEAMQEDLDRRRREQDRKQAAEHYEEARRAFEEGQLDLAQRLCLQALSIRPEYEEADALLDQIAEAMPDQGELLRQILRFADTTYARERRRLETEVTRLHEEGRERYDADDLGGAAERFREAITRIDESDFLTELLNERERTLGWLRKTLLDAEAQGLDLGPEPETPDPFRAAPDWRRDLHGLLGRMFTQRMGEEDPLIVYEVRPALVPRDARSASLAPGPFPSGMVVTRSETDLSRAWWAERWVRTNVGTGWKGSADRPRVLDRFGDVLIVQNHQGAHAKVRRLLDAFSPLTTPVIVDVAVVGATTAGGVKLASQLGLSATPRATGLDLVASNRLFAESLQAVRASDGLRLLGTVRLTLTDGPTAAFVVGQRSEHHPVYDGLPNPPLRLEEPESRYGVFLELFAEDLMNAEGARRAAVGVVARTRVPRGTVVVPRPTARLGYERIAQPMAEQRVEAVEILPHAGTMVVQGLSNPFPEVAAQWPGLLLVVAVRPADDGAGRTPMQDPLRTTEAPGSPPNGSTEEREYRLGPLATEVEDAVLVEGWPRRPLLEPVSPTAARRARERYLEVQLGATWSGIAEPGHTGPVAVEGEIATAALPPEAHARLKAAVDRLQAASTALYEVNVLTADVAEETASAWLGDADVVGFTPGTYLVTTAASERRLDERMRAEGMRGGLYAMSSRLLARATQKVAAHNLRALRIVQDLRFWRHKDGTLRYIPVAGIAEEGIAILVRPEMDDDGRRLVTIEALAARLRDLERLSLPDVEVDGGLITVARHHPVRSRRAAAPLGDEEAVVLTLPTPETSNRVILAKVTVRKLQ